ncbi:MAG: GNAT family N-acetyltransferase [Nitrospirota bacterium]
MRVRRIEEADVERVIDIYRSIYDEDFPFQEFYNARWVKKGVFDDNIIWLVAEDDRNTVVGTTAVMLNAGDADDLIGEFGRLVVAPECRSQGVGTELIRVLTDRVEDNIEWGFAECRSIHAGSQKIFEKMGFRTIGFEPLVYKLGGGRESMVLMARLFGNAAKLRKNNPYVIASVYPIGCQAMQNLGLEPDLIVAGEVSAYAMDDKLEIETLRSEHAYRLLRIGRGRTWEREIFGGMRLDYGYLKMASYSANYLVARKGEISVGALGFTYDPIDEKVRIFEMIAIDDATKGTLLQFFVDQVVKYRGIVYIEATVSAYYPRMQATLEQLGFFPVAFCPSMVFEGVERLDTIKMVKLAIPWCLGRLELLQEPAAMKDLVQHAFEELNKGQTIADVARNVSIFEGLGDNEIGFIRAICRERRYGAGELVFQAGEPSKDLFILMEGKIAIVSGEDSQSQLAEFNEGEVFGEMALLDKEPRSASAMCKDPSTLLVISYGDFHHLIERYPELGKKVIHNIARTLSQRLRSADRDIEWRRRD